MSFTQSFKEFNYIVDTSHKYIVSHIGTQNTGEKIQEVILKPIECAYGFELPTYKKHWSSNANDFEDLHDLLKLIRTLAGKPYKYKVDGTNAVITLDGFEVVTVVPNIVCTTVSDETIDTMYQDLITVKLNKRRCRLNKLLKKLDLGLLSNGDLANLESAVKHLK